MDNSKKYKQGMDLAVYAGILFCVLIQVIRTGNLPGLYLDAINPDYIAVQMLFPREHQIHWLVSKPWLCQIYHGCLTVIPALLSILITGTTSILQHHMVNGIVTSLCIIVLYKFLVSKRMGVNRFLAASVSFLLATMPSTLTIMFTQYYIELPETLCVLLSLCFFYKWSEDEGKEIALFFSYLMTGIAFYGYFNFLFFLPSLLVGTYFYCLKKKKSVFLTFLHGLTGFFMGCGVYFIGYTQMWQSGSHRDLPGQKRFLTIFIALYYINLWMFYKLSKSEKPAKIKYICMAGVAELPVVAFWIYKVLPVFRRFSEGLNISGDAGGLGERIIRIRRYLVGILSGTNGEGLIYRSSVTQWNHIWWSIILILAVVLLAIELGAANKSFQRSLWKSMAAILFLYLLCCIVFATRMQTQHFVPILFLFGIILALQLKELFHYIDKNKIMVPVFGVLFLVLIAINVVNENKIIQEIYATGGRGAFSEQINEISYEALEEKEKNRNQLYIFKDWGFLFGFNYLTKNQVMCVTDMDADFIKQYIEKDYDLVACYWKEEDSSLYEDFFEECQKDGNHCSIQKEIRYQRDGEVAFYMMKLIPE